MIRCVTFVAFPVAYATPEFKCVELGSEGSGTWLKHEKFLQDEAVLEDNTTPNTQEICHPLG